MTDDLRVLRYVNLHPLQAGLHIARTVYLPQQGYDFHGHDFAEICWVESGAIRHETPGKSQVLQQGQVVLIEPGQYHRLGGTPGGGRLINLAFSAAVLSDLRTRWGVQVWPVSPDGNPTVIAIDAVAAVAMARDVLAFRAGPGQPLDRDVLLGSLLASLRPAAPTAWPLAPPWLAQALAALNHPAHAREGLPALVRLSGRSREHVSREIRRVCGCSPTDVLQQVRMTVAEAALVQGDDPIADIAMACGFSGRAHFHRLFRARFGLAPAAYRRQARMTLGHSGSDG